MLPGSSGYLVFYALACPIPGRDHSSERILLPRVTRSHATGVRRSSAVSKVVEWNNVDSRHARPTPPRALLLRFLSPRARPRTRAASAGGANAALHMHRDRSACSAHPVTGQTRCPAPVRYGAATSAVILRLRERRRAIAAKPCGQLRPPGNLAASWPDKIHVVPGRRTMSRRLWSRRRGVQECAPPHRRTPSCPLPGGVWSRMLPRMARWRCLRPRLRPRLAAHRPPDHSRAGVPHW